MPIATELGKLIASGTRRIGEILIQTTDGGDRYAICHHLDAGLASAPGFAGLDQHRDPDAARAISTYDADGKYRFTKGQTNLKRGWVITLENEEQLRRALDHFYPAAVGLFLARRDGRLETENLRDKLERQTGMYRFARHISDAGAQKLVQSVCGPAHQCAKRILWQLDADTPLDDSEASRFNGIPGGTPESEAIPLLCREACNHFVAECRKAAKQEAG